MFILFNYLNVGSPWFWELKGSTKQSPKGKDKCTVHVGKDEICIMPSGQYSSRLSLCGMLVHHEVTPQHEISY